MKPLPRRTFLKGVGATLGLPWLEAMASASPSRPGTPPPIRLAWVYFPNGVIRDAWTPIGEGTDYRFGQTTRALADVRDDVLIVSDLAHHFARSNGDGPGDHARCSATYLTAAQAKKTGGTDIYLGTSVDQVAAAAIGSETRLPSLELGLERGRQAGRCDSGYSCAYTANVSWRSPTQPNAKEVSPRRAFERIFGVGESRADDQRRLAHRQSVLDVVAESAGRLRGRLGRSDRHKVDEYFQSIREVERRIERASTLAPLEVAADRFPATDPTGVPERIRLMYDLIALAFQTDATRIATYMVANASTARVYEHLGVRRGHHQLTHDRGEDAARQVQRIDAFLLAEFSRFVAKLRSMPEGEGSLLDRCAIVYGSAIGDGRRHNHDGLPCVVAGRAGGAITPGRHLRLGRETPMANLFVSMLDAAGLPVDRFGDSTGPLRGLST